MHIPLKSTPLSLSLSLCKFSERESLVGKHVQSNKQEPGVGLNPSRGKVSLRYKKVNAIAYGYMCTHKNYMNLKNKLGRCGSMQTTMVGVRVLVESTKRT